nr:MAG TPA: hypothetical protein [Caudoviricetes sp.]
MEGGCLMDEVIHVLTLWLFIASAVAFGGWLSK